MAEKKTLKVKLVRSVIGTRQDHRDYRAWSGLASPQQRSRPRRHAAVRGMINKVSYLVLVL